MICARFIRLLFLGTSYPCFRPHTVLSGGLLNFFKCSIYPLVALKFFTYDLETCSPSPLLEKTSDTLRFGPQIIENIFRDKFCSPVSLSHHVDVFEGIGIVSFNWVVKHQTSSFMMSISIFSTHGVRIFFFPFPSCRPLRFAQHHLSPRGFLSASNDGLGRARWG